ncbi:WXG100 family type VII secretion target [Amycolatopsis anabasis]|uniref:WXG100 family type VII secretion target n=1 Tax=Amycolatopsis anabasis TaxID=1840409 RepID=UPI00131C9A14|nr:hypothetical protein [Amycolatopsis anabasis]
MTDDSGAGSAIETASAGVEGLAGAVTSVLGQSGPIGALVQPVVDALRNVWEGYFGSPIPEGATNWNAYTHEQLYQMLWQNADVGDVSSVAAEWGRHSTELTGHASSLRDQRGALRSNWSGDAAELAGNRLGDLGERASGVGTRAGTVQQATQDAGDALADARNTMPPPPGDPTGLALSGAVAGAGAGAAIGAIVGAGAGGIGAGPGALMGAAIGAVAGGGGSLFLANVAAAERKAEAVHVMQRYESSLRRSSQAIAPPGAAKAGTYGALDGMDGQSTTAAGYSGDATSFGRGGMSWGQLVGSGPVESGAMADSRGSGAFARALMAARTAGMSELAAARAAANAKGMYPGSGARGSGAQDEEHRNNMPTIDQKLFDVDEPASTPVIGL